MSGSFGSVRCLAVKSFLSSERKLRSKNLSSFFYCTFQQSNMASSLTRSAKPKIYPEFGIDDALEELLGSQVPSNCDALRNFYFFNREKKLSPHQSYISTAENLLKRWQGSSVQLMHPQTVSKHVQALHKEIV